MNRRQTIERMRYSTYPVELPLSRYVACLWSLESESAGPFEAYSIPAYGCVEMIFHLGHPFATLYGDCNELQAAGVVAGHLTGAMRVRATGPFCSFGVRFRPAGHFPFLRMPGNLLDGRVVPLALALPGDGEALTKAVVAGRDLQAAFRTVLDWLRARWASSSAYELTESALNRISGMQGIVSVRDLTLCLGVTPRTLQRHVSTVSGLTPKQFCRLVRFLHVLRALYQGATPDWAGLATELGYYDQAHLIHDFRQFAGASPTRYLQQAELGRHIFATREAAECAGIATPNLSFLSNTSGIDGGLIDR